MKNKKLTNKIYIFINVFLILFLFISACSNVGATEEADSELEYKKSIRNNLCNYIADYWAGINLRYKGSDDFLSKCKAIKYDTEMELVHKVRPLVSDGHFYLGLWSEHKENAFSEARIIPMVVTYDLYDNTVIAKSKEHLRELGLKEGNIILKINGREVLYYIEKIIDLLPQSSYFESKEKAYRLLFTSSLKPFDKNYFEIPLFESDEESITITYIDKETDEIKDVEVDFEPLSKYKPEDILDTSKNDYWSVQRYYDVPETDTCNSTNEFATLIEIEGENWLIYHPLSFLYFYQTDTQIRNNFDCYLNLQERADHFILDLRDSVGGSFVPVNVMLGLLDVKGEMTLTNKAWWGGEYYDYGKAEVKAKKVEELPAIGERMDVYIWTNSICGSACDIFLEAIEASNEEHITILGKPSAGRVQAIQENSVMEFDITIPFLALYNENNIQLEGKPIYPEYYFDAVAEDYTSPNKLVKKLVHFIKSNNL